jgi:hypothetical protein
MKRNSQGSPEDRPIEKFFGQVLQHLCRDSGLCQEEVAQKKGKSKK